MGLATQEPLPQPVERPLAGRLGLNLPAKWWPTRSGLKAIEAAGFDWLQVHSPPEAVLREPRSVLRHARALRKELDVTGLRLVLHGPDELSVGEPATDRSFEGLLAHADVAGAERIVYHGANFAFRDGGDGGRRLAAEQRSLARLLRRAEETEVVVCIENLAPVFPGGPRLCHSPGFVARLVERLASPAAAACLDVGHAHIAAQIAGAQVEDFVGAAVAAAGLFHVHDNLGARRRAEWRPGVEPLRLDLHLPPGEGTLPWERIAPLIASHVAPVLLEVHPPHRRQPAEMAAAAQLASVVPPTPLRAEP